MLPRIYAQVRASPKVCVSLESRRCFEIRLALPVLSKEHPFDVEEDAISLNAEKRGVEVLEKKEAKISEQIFGEPVLISHSCPGATFFAPGLNKSFLLKRKDLLTLSE